MKRLIKIISYLLLGLIVLTLVLAMFTQTPIFKNWLRNQLETAFSSQTNGELHIGKIRGNLLNYILIEDLNVEIEKEPLFRTKRLLLQYDPTALFFNRISVRHLSLDSPEIHLRKNRGGSWQISELVPREPVSAEVVADPPGVAWQFLFPEIEINSASLFLSGPDSENSVTLPKEISDFDLEMGFRMVGDLIEVTLQRFDFETVHPDIDFRATEADFRYKRPDLNKANLKFETKASKIAAQTSIKDVDSPVIEFLLEGNPLSLDELRQFIPTIQLDGTARIKIKLSGPLDNLEIESEFSNKKSALALSGKLGIKNEPYSYDLRAEVSHLDLSQVLDDTTFQSDLNFKIEAVGEGLNWPDMKGWARIDMDSSHFQDYSIERCHVDLQAGNDSVYYDLAINLYQAAASLNGTLLADKGGLVYQLAGTVSDLQLDKLGFAGGLNSDLNLAVQLTGEGVNFDSMTAKLDLKCLPSRLNNVPIDSATFLFDIENQTVSINKFNISSPVARVEAAGDFSFYDESNISIKAALSDFSVLASAFPIDSIFGTGKIDVSANGPIDSLMVRSVFDLAGVATPDIRVERVAGFFNGVLKSGKTVFDFDVAVTLAVVADTPIDSARFVIGYQGRAGQYDVTFWQTGDLDVTTAGTFSIDSTATQIDLERLAVRYFEQIWGNDDTARIVIQRSNILFENLTLRSENQNIQVLGFIDSELTNDFRIELRNVQLDKYRSYFGDDIEIFGTLGAFAELKGTLSRPEIDFALAVKNGGYRHVLFKDFQANFNFNKDSLSWRANLSTEKIEKLLETSGSLPVVFSFSPFVNAIRRDSPLELKFNSRGIDVSLLEPFTKGLQDISGLLVADLVVGNTLNDLSGKGTLRVVDGSFRISQMGTKYRNFNLALALEERNIKIIDLRLRSRDGDLRFLEGGLALSQDSLTAFSSKFQLKNFEVMNNRKMRARTSGEIELSGSLQNLKFGGDLTVDEAVIHYERWLQEDTAVLLTSKPFFVISEDSVEFDTSGAMRFQKQIKSETLFTESNIYKNSRGQLSVEFLRNSWVRSKDTNIEITGKVAVVKESEDFVLQGNLSTARGFYSLLGNRFQITKGDILFDGDAELNANIDIEAVYRFLDQTALEPENREFKVLITGKMYEPQFQFKLDDEFARQDDLISILLFGQPGSGSQYNTESSVANGGDNSENIGNAARGILTAQTLNLLSNKLSEELKVDVIHIESGKDWQDSRVRIGKYLTPEVFVSLSQPFGSEGKQKVELEYALPRQILFFHLLLQAVIEEQGDSGADLIWKIEW